MVTVKEKNTFWRNYPIHPKFYYGFEDRYLFLLRVCSAGCEVSRPAPREQFCAFSQCSEWAGTPPPTTRFCPLAYRDFSQAPLSCPLHIKVSLGNSELHLNYISVHYVTLASLFSNGLCDAYSIVLAEEECHISANSRVITMLDKW